MAKFGPLVILVVMRLALLFPISNYKNAIACLLLVQLTPSKVCNVLANTRHFYFRAPLDGGMAYLGASILHIVLMLWASLFPTNSKCNCLASTGPIDPIQSLLCSSIRWEVGGRGHRFSGIAILFCADLCNCAFIYQVVCYVFSKSIMSKNGSILG